MEFCNGGCERCPVSMRLSSYRVAEKAKIRAELLAMKEREILEEEVRRELGWERGIRFGCSHGQKEETPPVASSWDKFYDYEPDFEGLRRCRTGSLDRSIVDVACPDVCFENCSALREAKKMQIRAELLARRERQVLEGEVRRELGMEREKIRFGCCYGQRDDGCLVPRLGFEERHLPSFIKDTLRRTPASLPDLMHTPAVKKSASLSENFQLLPPFPDFLPLNSVEPERSSRPSFVVADSVSNPFVEPEWTSRPLFVVADSVSKPCIEPVSSPKPSPMVISAVHELRPSPVPENKPLSSNYSGIKRKFGCDLCQITTTSKESLDGHFNGKRHKAATASNKSNNISASKSPDTCSSPEAENSNKPKNGPAKFSCKACGLKCDSRSILHAHLSEKKHWIRSTRN